MSKVLKGVWFVSLLGGLAGLLWTYASTPSEVKITEDARLDRELFFYLSLLVLVICNFSLYGISKLKYNEAYEYLRSWKFTFGTLFNGFFVVSVVFIAIFNGTQEFDFHKFGYLIIAFLSLMGLWLLALPFLIFFNKKRA